MHNNFIFKNNKHNFYFSGKRLHQRSIIQSWWFDLGISIWSWSEIISIQWQIRRFVLLFTKPIKWSTTWALCCWYQQGLSSGGSVINSLFSTSLHIGHRMSWRKYCLASAKILKFCQLRCCYWKNGQLNELSVNDDLKVFKSTKLRNSATSYSYNCVVVCHFCLSIIKEAIILM